MVHQKRILPRMLAVTRHYAKLTEELKSVYCHLESMTDIISSLEMDKLELNSRVEAHAKEQEAARDVVFTLTGTNIRKYAKKIGIPEEAITDEFLKRVAQKMEQIIQDAISFAFKS